MNLYLVERLDRVGYDQYSAFVVAASTQEAAVNTSPDPSGLLHAWPTDRALIDVQYIGTAAFGLPAGIVLASFNAG